MPKLHIKKEDSEITLLDEGDIQKKFDNLSTVATTGDYDDLSDKPTIPSKISDLTDDSNFLTSHQDISGKANISDIPTKISDTNQISKNGVYIMTEEEVNDDTTCVFVCTGNYIEFVGGIFIPSPRINGTSIINWGDGTTSEINSADILGLNHSYTDGKLEHIITWTGNIIDIHTTFASCSNLKSIHLPSTITMLGSYYFYNVQNLISISIPSSVTEIGSDCFKDSGNIIDYQLYWKDSAIVQYDNNKMPNNANTVFTIPYGETANYIANGYPEYMLQERDLIDKLIIKKDTEQATFLDEQKINEKLNETLDKLETLDVTITYEDDSTSILSLYSILHEQFWLTTKYEDEFTLNVQDLNPNKTYVWGMYNDEEEIYYSSLQILDITDLPEISGTRFWVGELIGDSSVIDRLKQSTYTEAELLSYGIIVYGILNENNTQLIH